MPRNLAAFPGRAAVADLRSPADATGPGLTSELESPGMTTGCPPEIALNG